jgi:hypothetical protein
MAGRWKEDKQRKDEDQGKRANPGLIDGDPWGMVEGRRLRPPELLAAPPPPPSAPDLAPKI